VFSISAFHVRSFGSFFPLTTSEFPRVFSIPDTHPPSPRFCAQPPPPSYLVCSLGLAWARSSGRTRRHTHHSLSSRLHFWRLHIFPTMTFKSKGIDPFKGNKQLPGIVRAGAPGDKSISSRLHFWRPHSLSTTCDSNSGVRTFFPPLGSY
jgi:hypothetical protein